MQPVARTGIAVIDFAGMLSNTGNIGNEETSQTLAELVNMACVAANEVRARPGVRIVLFDEDEE